MIKTLCMRGEHFQRFLQTIAFQEDSPRLDDSPASPDAKVWRSFSPIPVSRRHNNCLSFGPSVLVGPTVLTRFFQGQGTDKRTDPVVVGFQILFLGTDSHRPVFLGTDNPLFFPLNGRKLLGKEIEGESQKHRREGSRLKKQSA